jgi:hypothetical protein
MTTALNFLSPLDQARNAYARWFVREHFLRRDYYADWSSIAAWNRAQERGEVRFKKVWFSWSSSDTPSIHDEYWVDNCHWVDPKNKPRMTNHTVALADIDDPAYDGNVVIRIVRRGRIEKQDEKARSWLLQEAEYYRVLNEALLRSYGVDVKAP